MKNNGTFAKSLAAFFSLFLVAQSAVTPCTVAVVSGKATLDGRPLLWKNRDTSARPNKVAFLRGEKYLAIPGGYSTSDLDISTTSKLNWPRGITALALSPTDRPCSASPIGERIEILPWSISASCGPSN